MNLIQLQSTIFVDPATLSFVRFEDLENEPTATLRFQDGGAEVLKGDAALQLHMRLREASCSEEVATIATASTKGQGVSLCSSDLETPSATGAVNRLSFTVTAWSPKRNKAWYYRKDENGREYFHAFVNAKGSCSVRSFDANTGVFLGKQYEAGDYQEQFANLTTMGREVTVKNQPNLERDCKERLPESTLMHLRSQISGV
jgi:hypothetical protein